MSESALEFANKKDKKFVLNKLMKFVYFGKEYRASKGFNADGLIKLRCGIMSDWYADIRSFLLYDSEYSLQYVHDTIANMKRDNYIRSNQIMGFGYGGAILVSALSGFAQYNGLIIRSEKKDYGMKNSVIGTPISKDVIIVEDVLTSGGSLCTAISIAEQQGYTVRAVVVVMDRCVKAFIHNKKEIKEKYVYSSVFNNDDISEIRRMR